MRIDLTESLAFIKHLHGSLSCEGDGEAYFLLKPHPDGRTKGRSRPPGSALEVYLKKGGSAR